MDLTKIYGIGPENAKKIQLQLDGRDFMKHYNDPDIYEMLTAATRAYLKYMPISMPRRKIIKICNVLEKSGAIIAGSYRRGRDKCNDLDILISREISEKWLANYVYNKKSAIKFTEPFANGHEMIKAFIRIRPSIYMFADIFIYDDLAPYLLYATGGKEFNQQMRAVAKNKGYLLNQHGLFKNDKKILLKSEREFFDFLGMKYLAPHERS